MGIIVMFASLGYCRVKRVNTAKDLLKKNFFYVCSFLKERDRAQAGVGRRERGTQNLKQAPGSELSAQSPTWGSNS